MDPTIIHFCIKSNNLLWQRLIFWGTTVTIGLILITIATFDFGRTAFIVFLILSIILVGCSFFVANNLTKSDTKFLFQEGILTIEQTNNRLKKNTRKHLKISSISGFEISETKNGDDLIIHLKNNSYFKYPLHDIVETINLKNFLNEHLIELTKGNNPNFTNFASAYLFGLLLGFACTFTMVALLYGSIYLTELFHWDILSHKFLSISLYLIASALCWLFILRLTAKNKRIRYLGFSSKTYFFSAISHILILTAALKLGEINEQPIVVNRVNDLLNYKKNELFYIQQAEFFPERILIYAPRILSQKSKYLKIEHIFVTPICSTKAIETNQINKFWATRSYWQSLEKSTPKEIKDSLIRGFAQQSRINLMADLKIKPKFYKVLNLEKPLKNTNNKFSRLIPSSDHSKALTLVEPHWKTINAYKNSLQHQLYLMCFGILSINLIIAMIIAFNR